MKIPHISRTAKTVVAIVVLVLGALAFWFTQIGFQQPGADMTTEQPQLAPPPPQPEEKAMGKVRLEMEGVIAKWCEVECPYEDHAKPSGSQMMTEPF
jgi:hypothetical protein